MKTKLLLVLMLSSISMMAAVRVGVRIGGGYGYRPGYYGGAYYGPSYFSAGYYAPGAYVDSYYAPPVAPVSAYMPPAPGPGYSWVGGYYYPVGPRYSWRAGYWTRPPYVGARWYGPRYNGGRYYHGYWRR